MSYWQERAEKAISRMEGQVDGAIPELIDSINKAKKDLQKEIESFYGRYSKENKITLVDAQKQLDFNELKDFKGDLNKFTELSYKSIGTYNLELNNLSVKARITRLQALEFQCDTILQRLYQQMKANVESTVTDVYTNQYEYCHYEMENYGGFQHSFSKIDTSVIGKVLSTPVHGADISTRLWRQDLDTGFKIRQTLNVMFTTGKPPQYFAKELQKVIGKRDENGNLTGKTYEAYRLLYNESSFATNQADLDSYKDYDVDQYEISATLDLITSQICRSMDSKHFPLEKAVVGETFPPFHVNCRTTTVPYYEWLTTGERAARDKDGKSIEVPDMSYAEWKKKYIDSNNESGIISIGRDKMSVDVQSGAFFGALDPDSVEASAHAKKYYDSVRKMGNDTKTIAINVGWTEQAVNKVKRHVFLDRHNLGGIEPEQFDSDYNMATSWQRLIDGKNKKQQDIVLLKHEYLELTLMKYKKLSYRQAHDMANSIHNYSAWIKKEG